MANGGNVKPPKKVAKPTSKPSVKKSTKMC